MADKRTTADDVAAELRDGMTLGIGGWGSRRKPMALVRAILRTPVKDLTVVSYGGPDARGNAQYLGPDPYFDDLFCLAAEKRFVSVEKVVDTAELTAGAPVQSLLLNRSAVDGVVEAPRGAHFTTAVPDYGRDERFQRHYAACAKDLDAWPGFAD